MTQRGFSVIELVVVLGIIGILLSIATLQFNRYTVKSQIESQTRQLNADLAEVRTQALFRKTARAVVISGTTFAVYAGPVASGDPVVSKTLSYPVRSNMSGAIVFRTDGFLDNVGSGRGICLSYGDNPAAVDSLVLSTSRIYLGKWNIPEGSDGQCTSANITQR